MILHVGFADIRLAEMLGFWIEKSFHKASLGSSDWPSLTYEYELLGTGRQSPVLLQIKQQHTSSRCKNSIILMVNDCKNTRLNLSVG